ncbi:EPT/RTPC-like protein [Cryphonectria parasitica EP155]|uniref:EPT/RTPC-like protein n=1 Tax=Cryphonectria parasitica (strain ATCC 38755 / EP155) TaxID=660469 RepID=A0A9P4Y8Q7_CRYP1|nr:EPT/RTPC-like protein [Cryphonectria parasitica EP155]KAF3768551.1 EPT/RTPC-like protein [Cryphonectria parasitica EP155]
MVHAVDAKETILVSAADDENNGQTVRILITLSAMTTTPVKIVDIRSMKKNPGMTPALVAIVKWFAGVTEAEVEGNKSGNEILTFRPKCLPSTKLFKKELKINSGSMTASSVIFFQTVLPLLLFVGGKAKTTMPIELSIDGATNCLDAPSYEYLDQVFLPALEKYFGIKVTSKMVRRGWAQMTPDPKTVQKGKVTFKFHPLEWGSTLKPCQGVQLCDEDEDKLGGCPDVGYRPKFLNTTIGNVAVTMITPVGFHEPLKDALIEDIENRFPGAELSFKCEDSGHSDRFYVLVVAKSEYCQWARDITTCKRLKDAHIGSMSKEVSSQLAKDLEDEVGGEHGDCPVDSFLQDQLVIFQALADGRTCFPRNRKDESTESALKNLHPDFPLNEDLVKKLPIKTGASNDSMHTHLARYAAKLMLPKANFYNDGKVCIGAAVQVATKN